MKQKIKKKYEIVEDNEVKITIDNEYTTKDILISFPVWLKKTYSKCKTCGCCVPFQGSGFICPCKLNLYELTNMCQCLTCSDITLFVTNHKNEKISICHPFVHPSCLSKVKKNINI